MNPCHEEPCKSAREAYLNQARKAALVALRLKTSCKLLKLFQSSFRDAFLLWLALFAAAIACIALGPFPEGQLCTVLQILAGMALAWLAMLYILVLAQSQSMRLRQLECTVESGALLTARIDLLIACPPECWPPDFQVDCDC